MQNFVHLHVHTQYSLLDGQASIPRLVDKAIKDGMPGIAVTDHGNMFGIKEFWNYVKKKNGQKRDTLKSLTKLRDDLAALLEQHSDIEAYLTKLKDDIAQKQAQIDSSTVYSMEDNEALLKLKAQLSKVESMDKEFGYSIDRADERLAALSAVPDFKPIIGCEVYVAREAMELKRKEVKSDIGGWHLILLAKNLQGYKNLIKIVSRAWTDGFYNRPRTDHKDLERYHEGLICLSACLGGGVQQFLGFRIGAHAHSLIQFDTGLFTKAEALGRLIQRRTTKEPVCQIVEEIVAGFLQSLCSAYNSVCFFIILFQLPLAQKLVS